MLENANASEIPRESSRPDPHAVIERESLGIGNLCMALLGTQPEAEQAFRTSIERARAEAKAPPEGPPRGWIYAVARRECALRLERRSRTRSAAGEPPLPAGTTGEPPATSPSMVRARLEELRPSERDALILRAVCGLDFDEIAAACGVDANTAQERVSRALVELSSRIRGNLT